MNVYFIDPRYVKPNGWEPLLQYLKVNAVLSFIPKNELATELVLLIEPYLQYSYSGGNLKRFANNCVYWLREYFENNIRLISEDYPDVADMSAEERNKYSSQSPHNNLLLFDKRNCLIILELDERCNEKGHILPPTCDVEVNEEGNMTWFANIPTHMASYCLNILHKKHNHNLYVSQSAFIVFDKYFSRSYRYVHKARRYSSYSEANDWNRCVLTFKCKTGSGSRRIDFINTINRGVHKLSADNFPIVEVDGKSKFTRLITDAGYEKYQGLLDYARNVAEEYEEYESRYEEEDWRQEVEEMNRAFWRECGAAGSNCESWPGWE